MDYKSYEAMGRAEADRAYADARYDQPNYGANAALGTAQPTLRPAPPRPTISVVADMANELHSRLNMLEESIRTVHNRIGAESMPEACGNPLSSENGPVDFIADQIADAMRRIDNIRGLVETINARI